MYKLSRKEKKEMAEIFERNQARLAYTAELLTKHRHENLGIKPLTAKN